MKDSMLIEARKRAERAVEGMAEGSLKIAAFQTVLAKLLADSDPGEEMQRVPRETVARRGGAPNTLGGRVLVIKSEGFFKTQRTLGEVREALGVRGWHYPVTTLSGAMQSLVRRRELRRERTGAGSKQVWKYSNP
jgi:hypothetical protein